MRRDRATPAVVPTQSRAKRAVSNVARESIFASKSTAVVSAGSERPSGGAGASIAGSVSPCSCFVHGQRYRGSRGKGGSSWLEDVGVMSAALDEAGGRRRVARWADTYGKVSREPGWCSGRFARLAHPAVEAAALAVAIFPAWGLADWRGTYRLCDGARGGEFRGF
jgi:hypothetical protein